MSTTHTKDRTVLKGAVAAGAATAILLGGFGTFALWQASTAAGTSGTLASGDLALGTPATGEWRLVESDGVYGEDGAVVEDISAFVASPGDVLEYSTAVPVTVKGSDLKAKLTVSGGETFIAPAATEYVTVTINGQDALDVLPHDGEQPLEVAVRVEFSSSTPAGVAQDLDTLVSLDDVTFTLEQVAA
ncbi:alternate-type signal peptide domain-containing protein [Xylanimonas cellulosilytica]|nr:alternate-type signal peptide domain-containing protein [Xylanimonas cellulosilytica]